MTEHVDVAILGGGCAGLSLAARLAEVGGDLRVVVLEARTAYERDRTWCGWSVEPHPFSSCVDRAWSRWSVRSGGETVTQESERFRYEHIRADRFYDEARARIAAAPHVELRLGETVDAVSPTQRATRIATATGTLSAETVVDTRPAGDVPRGGFLQHFRGVEVTTRDAVFDPNTATLMDFDVAQDGAIHFVYVLPSSATRALVESTVLSRTPLAAEEYDARIASYLRDRYATEVREVHYAESGVIPMAAVRAAPGAAWLRAGTPGGAVKPSSGYAFHAIQRTTRELADALAGGGGAHRVEPRTRLDGWLDRIFLSFLDRHPERAPEVFLRLFRSVDPDRLVRFLMERASAGDRLRVVGAMPKLSFAREAVRVGVA